MTTGIGKKKPFKGSEHGKKDVQYIDLGSMDFDDESFSEHAGTQIKFAEIYRFEDMKNLIKHLYDGHNLIIDYSSLANDDIALKRITTELNSVSEDTKGDVVGIGNNLLVVTSNGITIDRMKIRGSF